MKKIELVESTRYCIHNFNDTGGPMHLLKVELSDLSYPEAAVDIDNDLETSEAAVVTGSESGATFKMTVMDPDGKLLETYHVTIVERGTQIKLPKEVVEFEEAV